MKEYPNQNNKPLNLDIEPSIQPEGTSRFRLNAVPETNSGEQGFVANEGGNVNKFNLPNQNIPIGEIAILDNKTVIFSVKADNTNSEIGIYNENLGIYSPLINVACLNFKITNQVKGIFKIREGCNINIYFTDDTNPWRTIDINNLNQYKDNLGNFDCNSFKLFRDYDQANINMRVFNSGGNTKVGVYQFTYQYLDDDFNPQPWNTPANPIPIVKDNLNDYVSLDGDVTNTDTNKSIQIQIDNIDTRYSYVRVGLIVSTMGTGFNSNAYILEEVPVENNSITYLFSGIDPNKTQNTDLEAFTYLPPDYYTGKDLKQIDNSLILAAPKAKDINYVPFIQAALQIQSKYLIKDLFAEQRGETSFSNRYPNSSFYNKSLMRDEVYSFGIVYIFKDGTETPAFHIPGRAKNTLSDGTTYINPSIFGPWQTPGNALFNPHNRPNATSNWDTSEYDNNTDPVAYLNKISEQQVVNGKIERWKLFNTAVRTEVVNPNDNFFTVKGELAYWESQDYTYPDTKDCNDDFIYPVEFRNQPVRYHKMPDTTLEPHFYGYGDLTNPTLQDLACIRPLNLEFTNINIPTEYQDQIQGYRIVRVERNEFNSSVIDKGILYANTDIKNPFGNQILYYNQALPFGQRLDILGDSMPSTTDIENVNNATSQTSFSLHSPKTKINKNSSQGDYIKIERNLYEIGNVFYGSATLADLDRRFIYDEASGVEIDLGDEKNSLITTTTVRYNNSIIPSFNTFEPNNEPQRFVNRVINKQGYIQANQNNPDALDLPFINNTSLETYAIKTNNTISYPVYAGDTNLTTLKFKTANTISNEVNGYFLLEADNYRSTCLYASLKKYLPNQYNGLFQQIYSCPSNISNNSTYLYSDGDTFISDWAFKKMGDYKGSFALDNYPQFTGTPDLNGHVITIRAACRFWCESEINMELRNSDNTFLTTTLEDVGNNQQEQKFNAIGWYYPRNYNESIVNSVNSFLDPENAWDNVRYGTVRNYYAYNKDFSIQNTIRAFFPLPINYDYCNLCRVKFPVRLANSNKAYQEERADNYRIFLPNNYRDIPSETGEISNIFIKNNKLFIQTTQSLWLQEVKPQQIQTDQATLYVGTGEFWGIPPNEVITTTHGYAGCQNRFGTIDTPFGYFYPSVRERKVFLFNDKLSEISNQGLRNWFENNLEFEYLKQYPSTAQFSQGIVDNPSNPVGIGFIVAYDKRYRRIIFSKKDYKTLNPNLLLVGNEWYLDDKLVYITDKTLFENKSWTISYHPDSQGWFSWHSYLPFFMFNTQNNYYSFSNDAPQVAWIHNQNNYQQFYQDTYPFINELIFNKQTLSVNTFPTIQWYSILTNNNQEVQDTFDKAIIYNDFQSSGELTLVNQVNPFQTSTNPQESLIKRTERKWALNSYRDYATNTPVFTSDWASTQNDYYIDKVPTNINPFKNVFELEKFRDNYLACRFVYSKPNNKFLSKFIIDTEKISPR